MEIELRNVGIIKSAHLQFIEGLNLIIGPSSSGKSTLLRALRSFIDNTFSDSNISYGETRLAVKLQYKDHTAIYVRDLKNPQRKSAYQVDGQVYTKLGRSALDSISLAFGLNPVEIDGEKVSFNFSSQFSGPFLLLGSPSLLYSILTYRTTFDVTQINTLYFQDLKQVKNEISSVERSMESLKKELEIKEAEMNKLSDVPSLYAQSQKLWDILKQVELLQGYITAKHNIEKLRISINSIIEAVSMFDSVNHVYLQLASLKGYLRATFNRDMLLSTLDLFKDYNPLSLLKSIDTLSRYIHSSNIYHRIQEVLSSFFIDTTDTLDILNKFIDTEKNAQFLESEIKSIDYSIKEAEAGIKEVGVCPLCGSIIGA